LIMETLKKTSSTSHFDIHHIDQAILTLLRQNPLGLTNELLAREFQFSNIRTEEIRDSINRLSKMVSFDVFLLYS